MPKIEIIIPAFNEEFRLRSTLLDYLNFFANQAVLITVVLNGCTDQTKKIVTEYLPRYPHLKLVDLGKEIGKGLAIAKGWQQSTAELVGFVDADNSTVPAEFLKLIKKMETSSAIGAVASRFQKNSEIVGRYSYLRGIMSNLFRYLVRWFLKMPYTDTQCGAKIFRRSEIIPLLPLVKHQDMLFDLELLYRLYQQDKRAEEIAIRWVDVPGSASLGTRKQFLKTGWTMLKALKQIK